MGMKENWYVLPGNGPWRILPECPSENHNTYNASCRGEVDKRCICPRGLEMKRRQYSRRPRPGQLAEELLLYRWRKSQRAVEEVRSVPFVHTRRGAISPPEEIRRGACRTREGMRLMDQLLDVKGRKQSAEWRLKALCDTCPLVAKEACARWVREAEAPAGSWQGVYAGLTQKERAHAGL